MANEGAANVYGDSRSFPNDDGGKRLTREYHLRQGALRGLIVKPSRQYDFQFVEMFLGIPYAAPPTGHLRFMPPGKKTIHSSELYYHPNICRLLRLYYGSSIQNIT